jgi:hypothetical protein
MENTVESAKEELIKQVNLVQTAALVVGLLYVSGENKRGRSCLIAFTP